MAISINKVSEEIKQKIIEDYLNNISMRELEKRYDVSRSTIAKYLEKHNIKTVSGNHYRMYVHDFDFFENINTEEKAYWLGFMFADGYIVDNSNRYGEDHFGITLAIQDEEIIEKYKRSIKATNPIKKYIRQDGQDQVRLLMTSQKTVNDLISHGCYKQKTKILEPPRGVPEKLIHHFVRGYFDGDGCITFSYKASYTSYAISIVSTLSMVNWIYEQIGMGYIIKDKRHETVWEYALGGNLQVIKFYKYLYSDATIYMERKYQKFQKLLQKYGENQGIND